MINLSPSSIYDLAHLLDAGVLILSFALLLQTRLFSVLKLYSYQALVLATAAAWQAYAQDAPQLLITAAITFIVKALIIPIALHKMILHFDIQRSVEPVISSGMALVVALGLVALSIVLVFPITASSGALTRESLAVALSVILLGFLMMITRRKAISQVVGFLSLENGLILAAVGVKGMPLVVELSIAFTVLVAFVIFGIFFFRIRERFDTLDISHLERIKAEQNVFHIRDRLDSLETYAPDPSKH